MARLFDGPPLLDKENGDIFVFSFLQPTKARKISYREQQELLRIGMMLHAVSTKWGKTQSEIPNIDIMLQTKK